MKKFFSLAVCCIVVSIFSYSPNVNAKEMLVFNPPSNIRDKPDGNILCAITEIKNIDTFGEKNGWIITDACGVMGVIHKSQVKEISQSAVQSKTEQPQKAQKQATNNTPESEKTNANLLINGSFENSTSSWHVVNFDRTSYTSVTDENAFDESFSIKTVHTKYNPSSGSWTSIGQDVSNVMQPDKEYLLSCYYLTTCPDSFSFRMSDRAQVYHTTGVLSVDNPIADGKWHQVSKVFSLIANILNSNPIFTFNYDRNVNRGTIYLDKISISSVVSDTYDKNDISKKDKKSFEKKIWEVM
ncbi:MAG: hypothetical protein HQK67_11450 [Desulfamplus sp.]|nr:hypothetical protein [Desulfamplus sp.]